MRATFPLASFSAIVRGLYHKRNVRKRINIYIYINEIKGLWKKERSKDNNYPRNRNYFLQAEGSRVRFSRSCYSSCHLSILLFHANASNTATSYLRDKNLSKKIWTNRTESIFVYNRDIAERRWNFERSRAWFLKSCYSSREWLWI